MAFLGNRRVSHELKAPAEKGGRLHFFYDIAIKKNSQTNIKSVCGLKEAKHAS